MRLPRRISGELRASRTFHGRLRDRPGQPTGVDDTGDTQGAPEGPSALGKREASRIGMNVRSSTRPPMPRIGHQDDQVILAHIRDDSQ
jgi:hypothetical protein